MALATTSKDTNGPVGVGSETNTKKPSVTVALSLANVVWSAERKVSARTKESIAFEDGSLDVLISETSNQDSIDSVGFEISVDSDNKDREVYLRLWCDGDGSVIEYSGPDDETEWGALSRLAETVESILRNN